MLGDHTLNIAGSEWIIIVFVALVLILGTNKLPEAAKKLGRAVNEYNKAKDGVQNQMKNLSNHNVEVGGPVQNERQKLEEIAKSIGEDPTGKTTDDLRQLISDKMGKKKDQSQDESE